MLCKRGIRANPDASFFVAAMHYSHYHLYIPISKYRHLDFGILHFDFNIYGTLPASAAYLAAQGSCGLCATIRGAGVAAEAICRNVLCE